MSLKFKISISLHINIIIKLIGGICLETLSFGSNGTNIELLQLALKRSGFYNGEIDGKFGSKTHNAAEMFQQSCKLTPDGAVGDLTWEQLMPYLRGYKVIIVQDDVNFWTLAQSYNTTVRAISTANPDLDPINLKPGQEVVVPYGFSIVPTNINYTHALVSFIVEGLKARYPFITVDIIGKSVMGKNLFYLKIGRGSTQVFYNAAHHANEWITTPILLKFFEDYSRAFSSGGRINNMSAVALYTTTTLFIVPLVNPDGVDLVNGAVPKNCTYYVKIREYSSNYPNIPFPSGWKANINGVDLNINYPAQWERAKNIKFEQGFTKPGLRNFVGTAPLSEPESKAVYNFTLNHDFALILAYHSQGREIYWHYLDFMPDGAYEIAKSFSNASGYKLEDTPEESSYAGYRDWFIQTYDRPGYTVEVGEGVNPLPISQFNKIYNDNIGILTFGMSEALRL